MLCTFLSVQQLSARATGGQVVEGRKHGSIWSQCNHENTKYFFFLHGAFLHKRSSLCFFNRTRASLLDAWYASGVRQAAMSHHYFLFHATYKYIFIAWRGWIFENHTLKALNIPFKKVVLPGRVKCGGTEEDIVVAHGCQKRKKLKMWPVRGNSGGSWPPAFPCFSDTFLV